MKSEKGVLKTISPIFLWMIFFFVAPIVLISLISFFTRGQYGEVVYKVTFDNYIRLFNPLYVKIFFNSILISFVTTFVCLVLGYPFAYFIARASKKYRGILMLLIILPFWTNSLVRTYAMIMLLRTEGLINTLLMNLHIISAPLKLLYNNTAVLIGMVYMMFPFMVMPLYSSIDKLDFSLLDAASDLGASPRETFMKVTLPLTKGGIISGCLLVFVPTLGYFFIPDLLGGSKVVLISNLIKNQFLSSRNWPLGSAISVVLIIVMFLMIKLYSRLGGSKSKMEVF
jgi:spermidine/putrescine transport system permease protein